MSLSERIGRHLRGNLVGYLALFVALSGTAIALPGKKTVKSDDLATGAVKAKAIKAGAVTNRKLAGGAVSSGKIAEGSVVSVDLGDGAVTNTKLADDAVSRSKVGAGEINGGKLANGSVNSAKVNDGSLQGEDFAPGQLSDGFVAETDPGTFNLPRAGEVFVTATFTTASCGVSCTYSVTVDGNTVPGTATTGDLDQQATLTGVTASLPAGDHSFDIVATGSATITEPTIAAVLLQ